MKTKLNNSNLSWYNPNGKRFCNQANCPHKFEVFKKANMIEYLGLYFCSEKCLDAYKKENQTDGDLLKW